MLSSVGPRGSTSANDGIKQELDDKSLQLLSVQRNYESMSRLIQLRQQEIEKVSCGLMPFIHLHYLHSLSANTLLLITRMLPSFLSSTLRCCYCPAEVTAAVRV